MRFKLTALALLLAALATPAAADCNGKAEVEAAFKKRLAEAKAWRTEIRSKDVEGGAQEETYEFLPPDRMYRKVTTRGETIESIGIGRWAWTNIGGGYAELQPQFAQMVMGRLQQEFAEPKVSAEFTCLGKKTFAGKEYLAYQTAPEKTDAGVVLARTIMVAPETGLPAFNVIGAPDLSGELWHQEAISYPADITIEKP